MNINLKKIGMRLKELRVKHNLTQREVAEVLHIKIQHIQNTKMES